MHAEPYQTTVFNQLLPIEVANKRLGATNKLALALRVLAPLFLHHKVADRWGIGLLHKHWSLETDELPIQITQYAASCRELITQPRRSFIEEYWPSVFAVMSYNPSRLQPLEFSADAKVREAFLVLRHSGRFASEFCETLSANSLEDTFALTALRETLAADSGLVEFTYDNRTSIVRDMPTQDLGSMSLIQTSWRFSVGPEGECEKSCFLRCMSNEDGDHEEEHVELHKPPDPPSTSA